MRHRGLVVYTVSAFLLRSADAAAIIGVVLAARDAGAGAATGLLAACITLPHLLGPFAARVLDRARSPRIVLAGGGALYALALGTAITVLPSSTVASAVALLVAGAAGPLLTGGLSSRLADLVGPAERVRRRAQGLDALTYGVSATVGPAVVAAVASTAGPVVAVLVAAGAALVGALVVLALPGSADATPDADAPDPGPMLTALAMLVRRPGLRRTTVATAVTAVPLGAVPLIAVATVDTLHTGTATSALLTAAYGGGNLVASAVLVVVPLRGAADRLVRWGTAAVLVGFAAGLLALTLPAAVVVFALLGATTAVLFTASLAARAAYAPAGAEAQVFVSMAGVKVAASSVGAAAAGALVQLGGPALFAVSLGVVALTLVAVSIDRAAP